MLYHISICHPDQAEIEIRQQPLNSKDALSFFQHYPWKQQLELFHQLPEKEIQYNPSLSFKHSSKPYGLEITTSSHKADQKISFSIWYERPVLKNIFFGLFGKKEVPKVVEKWSIDQATVLNYLSLFLDEKYTEMERFMSS